MRVCLCHCSRESALIRSNLVGRDSVRSGNVTITGHAKVPRTTSLCVATQEILQNVSRSCDIRVIFFKLPRIKCQQMYAYFSRLFDAEQCREVLPDSAAKPDQYRHR